MKLSEELKWRGLANQTTFTNISELDAPRTFYMGVDPSAASMHIGNLVQVMVVRHLIKGGHKAILLVGGATGMIGDPKEDGERDLQTLEEIDKNKAGIIDQYKRLLGSEEIAIVDNYDWFKDIGYLDFLRDIGKYFSMTQLLDREFIKARVGEGGVGISYAEFSYSLIQGYDYLHLYREMGATLQVGGSDQWGNMLSGAQMIKKHEAAEAHVWTVPLVVDKSTGKKFGKSEGNAVWLDSKMTSPYKFYQFWFNVDDKAVSDYLKIFTLIQPEELEALIKQFEADRAGRAAQKYLAHEVTKLAHGTKATESVERVSGVLFGDQAFDELSEEDLNALAQEIPVVSETNVVSALVAAGVVASNGEAHRLISGGAISVNGKKITEDTKTNAPSLIKKGKNAFVLIE